MTSEASSSSAPPPASSDPCLCGSGQPYGKCCGKQAASDRIPEPAKAVRAGILLASLVLVAWLLNPSDLLFEPAPLNLDAEAAPAPGAESPWEILPTNFTDLPEVDLGKLEANQKRGILLRLNTEPCPCGCGNNLAGCRVTHSICRISAELANRYVERAAASSGP